VGNWPTPILASCPLMPLVRALPLEEATSLSTVGRAPRQTQVKNWGRLHLIFSHDSRASPWKPRIAKKNEKRMPALATKAHLLGEKDPPSQPSRRGVASCRRRGGCAQVSTNTGDVSRHRVTALLVGGQERWLSSPGRCCARCSAGKLSLDVCAGEWWRPLAPGYFVDPSPGH